MKKYNIYLCGLLLAMGGATVMQSCTEDKYYEVDINDVPEASAYENMININVDQTTNTAYFTFEGEGVYPVWIVDGKSYSTSHSWSRFYRKAGDYQVEVKIGNANGMSKGTIVKTFHMDKTVMNGFPGFVYDSPFNLWTAAAKSAPSFWYAPGWSQIADPAYSFDGDSYSLTLPEATTDQWQAQMHVTTDISLEEGEHYDGSIIFTASQDMSNVTIKMHPEGDDDDAHCVYLKRVNFAAGEPTAIWFSDSEAPVPYGKLVYTFDFGGNPAGVELIIENIVLKKHSDDDGTVVPELPSTPEPAWVDVNSPDNLWSTAAWTNTFWYAPGWNQIADPVFTIDGNVYTIELPEATFETWQAQCAFNTDIASPDADALYDFRIEFESNTDLPGVMVKLTQTDEVDEEGNAIKHDDNFFFADPVAVPADTKTTYWQAAVKAPKGAMHAMSLVLDFGGNPAGTTVTISNIVLQKHRD